jgi:nucleoid-associated protein YgaU
MQYQQKTSTKTSGGAAEGSAASTASLLHGAGYAQQQQLVGASSGATSYVVKAGDTLSAIAAKALGSAAQWRDLWDANRATIKNPNAIYPGQVLTLPGGTGTEAPAPAVGAAPKTGSGLYVVQSGDTLSEIAAKTLGSAARWRDIWNANKSKIPNPNVIYPGLSLAIPGGAGTTAPEPAKPTPAPAAPKEEPKEQPAALGETWVYVVKPMDSLSWIAKSQLGDSSKWKLIFDMNRDVLSDPATIHPGMQLKLPGKGPNAPAPAPDVTPPDMVDKGGAGTLDPAKLSPLQKVCYSIYKTKGSLIAAHANTLGIEEAVLAAVLIAESSGSGYGADGRLKIRFESHIFEKYTGTSVSNSHGSQDAEYQAFEKARNLNDNAAYLSISMGAAQIMGFNHATVGYSSPKAMFEAFQGSEEKQLGGLFDFVAAHPNLVKAAKNHDWGTFAKGYNGPAYKKYGYDTKLANYYAGYSQILKMV